MQLIDFYLERKVIFKPKCKQFITKKWTIVSNCNNGLLLL